MSKKVKKLKPTHVYKATAFGRLSEKSFNSELLSMHFQGHDVIAH